MAVSASRLAQGTGKTATRASQRVMTRVADLTSSAARHCNRNVRYYGQTISPRECIMFVLLQWWNKNSEQQALQFAKDTKEDLLALAPEGSRDPAYAERKHERKIRSNYNR